MVKQVIKKKDFNKKPSVSDIKKMMGLDIESDEDLVKSAADKPMEFIVMPEAFQDALKLPGIPMGYMTLVTGWSNTGKSTLKYCLIASCIKSGILPVIYETENHFDWQYAIACGVEARPIYKDVEVEDVDEETGEILGTHTEKMIINYDGDFVYMDSKIIANRYGNNDYSTGKQTKTKRKVAVIEDIAYSINEFLDKQDAGVIQQPICFIWDSIGSIGGFKSYASKAGNNMFDAGSISVAFNSIINDRIPSSKKVSEPYTNTMFCINKIWNDSMNGMPGIPSIELKGGKAMFYGARLIIHVGGMAKSAVKQQKAKAKGNDYVFGIVTKIRVNKNQLPSPYTVNYEGEMACVHNGIIPPDKLEEYKKVYMKEILKKLEENCGEEVDASDVTFTEEDDSIE